MRQISSQTRFTVADYVFLLIAGILFYLLYQFTSFPIDDDAVYQFIGGMSCDTDKSYEPIKSFKDVFVSQFHDYQYVNGRFIVHCIVQCFCGIWGMEAFRIVNTLVFLLFCAGLMKLIRFKVGFQQTDKYLIAFSLFCLLPIPGYVLFGTIAYSVNYLWTSCAVIWLLYLYFRLQIRTKTLSVGLGICVFLAAFIVGALQESFSIGISAALFLHILLCYKKSNRGAWLVIGFWIGSCFLILAPGNFIRAAGGNFSILGCVSRFTHSIFELRIFFLLLLSLLIFFINSKYKCIRFVRLHSFWFMVILINILFSGFVAYTAKRQMTCVELFSFILLLILIYTELANGILRYRKVIATVSVVLIGTMYIPVYLLRKENYGQQMKMLQKVDSFKERVLVAEEYINYYMEKIYDDYLCKNYVVSLYSYNHDDWSRYYWSLLASDGKFPRQLVILPRTPEYIAEHCVQKNCLQENVYQFQLNDNFYMTVIRISAEMNIENFDIYVWAKPVNLFGRIRSKMFHTQSLNGFGVDKLRSFVKDGFRYMIMFQPFPMEKVDIKQL